MREIIDIMIINILLKRKVQLEILTQNYKMFEMLIRAELEHLTVTLWKISFWFELQFFWVPFKKLGSINKQAHTIWFK